MDLARIAGLNASGVICEIMNEDGTMARVPQLIEFCREHKLKMVTVADLIRYRMQHERYVRRIAEATLPTQYGDFRMIAYSSDVDHDQHIAIFFLKKKKYTLPIYAEIDNFIAAKPYFCRALLHATAVSLWRNCLN